MTTYLFAVQTSVEGIEVCSAEVETKKFSDVTVECDTEGNVSLLHGDETLCTGYAPVGMGLRLCRWNAGKLDKRAVIRDVKRDGDAVS